MKKPTPSRDGVLRYTVTVKFRVGLGDIADAVACECQDHIGADEAPDDVLKHWNKRYCTSIWKSRAGRSDSMWADAGDVQQNIQEAARDHVRKLFQELISDSADALAQ